MKRLKNIKLDLIDVSEGKRKRGRFGGNNGKKRYWEYDNVIYMIKHQDRNNINIKFKSVRGTSIKGYNNAVLSEYIGSNLINFINFDNMFAQHTFLIKENNQDNQKETFWVACEHLDKNRDDGFEFYTLSQIDEFDYADKNQNELNIRERHKISFNDMTLWIKEVGSKSLNIDQEEFVQYFYNMFVIDAFLLNWDRNPTNWGFLIKYDEDNDEIIDDIMFAPLIDQGGSLFAKSDFEGFELINNLETNQEVDQLIQQTRSFFKYDDTNNKINYVHFLSTTNNINLLKKFNEFIHHMENIDIKEIIDSLSLPQEYKQTYTKLLERSLFNINKFVNLNPLYKGILNDQTSKEKINKILV